jgi:REP element-mobilizing transposase RayT
MILNETGRIAKEEWYKLTDRFPQVRLGPFCVMPNHIHGIIEILPINSPDASHPSPSSLIDVNFSVGAGLAPALASNVDNPDMIGSTPGNRDMIGSTPGNREMLASLVRAGASPAPPKKSSNHEEEGIMGKEKVALGNIIGAYKSLVMRECMKIHKIKYREASDVPLFGKIWHRNYYEHIIRTQISYDAIALYIVTNAKHWTKDKFFLIS